MSHFKLSTLIVLLVATAGAWAQLPADFEPYTAYNFNQDAQTVAIGDLNGDGRNDVAVTALPSTLFVFYQQPDGTLTSPVVRTVPNRPVGLAIDDLNGDGLSDIAIGGTGGLISLYYQQPDGSLGLPVNYYAYGTTSGIVIGDFNSDGLKDFASSTVSYGGLFVFNQNPTGGYGLADYYVLSGATSGTSITKLDYNADARTDIALVVPHRICYLTQNDAGKFDAPAYLPSPWAYSVTGGDITGDGLDDLVYTVDDYQPYALIGVYAQDTTGIPAPLSTYFTIDKPKSLALADVDGDQRTDAITIYGGQESLIIHNQTPEGTLAPGRSYQIPYNNAYQPGALAVGDINSDGLPDIALASGLNGLVLLMHTGTGDDIDDIAPACSGEVAGSKGLNEWYVSQVTVSLSAEDNPGGSGVKGVYFTLDGTNWIGYTGEVTLGMEGVTQFSYYAEDAAGNRSAVISTEIKVDTTGPVVSLQPSVTTLWPPTGETVDVSVNVDGSDAVSGLAGLHLQVLDEYGLVQPEMDVASGQVAVPLVAFRNDGDMDGRVYTLILTGTDSAGNTASVQSTVTVPHGNPKPDKPDKPKPPRRNKR